MIIWWSVEAYILTALWRIEVEDMLLVIWSWTISSDWALFVYISWFNLLKNNGNFHELLRYIYLLYILLYINSYIHRIKLLCQVSAKAHYSSSWNTATYPMIQEQVENQENKIFCNLSWKAQMKKKRFKILMSHFLFKNC